MSSVFESTRPDAGPPRNSSEQAERELLLLGDQLREVEEQVKLLRRQFEAALTAIRAGIAGGGNISAPGAAAASPMPAGTDANVSADAAVLPGGIPGGDAEVQQNLHREARRYARLLVSEIELYHPVEVSEGRAHKDLYSRLQPHINRSRRAYESRYGPAVISSPDYFHEELVRTLAEGDVSHLGAGYSGPSA